jgi:hypothetical protein
VSVFRSPYPIFVEIDLLARPMLWKRVLLSFGRPVFMQPDANPEEVPGSEEPTTEKTSELGGPLLNRVRQVARKIEKRVRDTLRDTEADLSLSSEGDTTEQPPIPPEKTNPSE